MFFQRSLLPHPPKKVDVVQKAVFFVASAKLHKISCHPCLEVKEAKQRSEKEGKGKKMGKNI